MHRELNVAPSCCRPPSPLWSSGVGRELGCGVGPWDREFLLRGCPGSGKTEPILGRPQGPQGAYCSPTNLISILPYKAWSSLTWLVREGSQQAWTTQTGPCTVYLHVNQPVLLMSRQGSGPFPRKRNAKRQNGCLRRPYKSLRREVKGKGGKERYTHLNAEFQRIARGDKIALFLPGESHGRRSLIGYSPWGRKESDTTEPT